MAMSLVALVARHWPRSARLDWEGIALEPRRETGRGVDSQPTLPCASRNSIMIMMARMVMTKIFLKEALFCVLSFQILMGRFYVIMVT